MEFISNLIKRPVSLVSGGGEVTDKPQESTSRPTTIGSFENAESLQKELNSANQPKENQQENCENIENKPRPNSTSRPTTIGSFENIEILQKDLNSLAKEVEQMENIDVLQKDMTSMVKEGVQQMENLEILQKDLRITHSTGVGEIVNMQQNTKPNESVENPEILPKINIEVKSINTANKNKSPNNGDDKQQQNVSSTDLKPNRNVEDQNHNICDENQVKQNDNFSKNVIEESSTDLKTDVVQDPNDNKDKKNSSIENQESLNKDISEEIPLETNTESNKLSDSENCNPNIQDSQHFGDTCLKNSDKREEGITEENVQDTNERVSKNQLNSEDNREKVAEIESHIKNSNNESQNGKVLDRQTELFQAQNSSYKQEEDNKSEDLKNIQELQSHPKQDNVEIQNQLQNQNNGAQQKQSEETSQISAESHNLELQIKPEEHQEQAAEPQECINDQNQQTNDNSSNRISQTPQEDNLADNVTQIPQDVNTQQEQTQIQQKTGNQEENVTTHLQKHIEGQEPKMHNPDILEDSQTNLVDSPNANNQAKTTETSSNIEDNNKKSFESNNLEGLQNSIPKIPSDNQTQDSQNIPRENTDLQSVDEQLPKCQEEITLEHQQIINESNPPTLQQQIPLEFRQNIEPPSPSPEPQLHNRPLSSMTSSLNGNITDFIGVPEEVLKEFDEEYLPPPPPPLLLPPDDDNIMHSQTPSPPPPPPVLTSSMTASQTIDELLSEITDNLTLAGINDEVLAIASPHQKSEHSPLSSKTSLNNSKSTPKTPTNNGVQQQTAAGTAAAASPAVFEANSTLHKFHVDPELATGLFDDHHQQHQPTAETATELQNTSSVTNKSSNKFVGLTEFDEAKIPELPGDLNPNIEEQYNVTFEECFIPTLTAKLSAKELPVEKTHLLLPNEMDNTSMSSANETFADCQDGNAVDDRDPLATTFAEQPTLNTTVEVGEGECYESAIQDDLKSAADITMDVGQTQTIEEVIVGYQRQEEIHPSLEYEEEPMDVDMNATMEMIQNSAQNIENVEKVIQHVENILHNLEGPTQPIADNRPAVEDEVKIIGSIAKPTESSKMTFVVNPENIKIDEKPLQHLEMEQSIHDISLNKSIEIPMNKSKTLSSECVITTVNNETHLETVDNGDNLNTTKESAASNSMDQKNLTINVMNTSNSSSVSAKSPTSKLNVTTSLSTSTGSLKSSAPSSPSFPIKKTSNVSAFPQSPKLKMEQAKPTFLEKSDYMVNLESKVTTQDVDDSGNMNGTFVHPGQPVRNKNRLTFGVDQGGTLAITEENKRLTFNVEEQRVGPSQTDNKRLTFNVQSNEVPSELGSTFPAKEKTENTRRTFCLNDISEQSTIQADATLPKEKVESRRTFNVPSEEPTPMDTSYAAMDVDDTLPQNATMAIETASLNVTKPMASAFHETRSQSPPLPTLQQRSQSPALQNQTITKFDSIRSNSPPLPTMQKRSNSPPLPTMQKRPQSPPLPTVAMKTKSIANESSESLHFIQKRPSIHSYGGDVLSEKEQTNIKIKDEKDIYYEKSTPSPMEEVFTAVSATSTTLTNTSGFSAFDQSSPTTSAMNKSLGQQIPDDEFQGNSNLILNPSDFDYLLTKGNNNTPVDRSSLLLKFDPLLGCPVPANQGQQTQQQQQLHLQIPTNLNNNPCLSPTIEEDELNESTNRSFVVDNARTSLGSGGASSGFGRPSALSSSAKLLKERSQEVKQQLQQQQQNKRQLPQPGTKKNATMSVDVIKDMSLDNNDCNKTFENSNSTQPDDKQINYKMDELEKKVKNEVLKTEDIEKKLREAELREEALIKRITEKDKTVAKMTGVIEAYEKAIAELIAEKEQLIQNYEKQLAEVKADRDSNYHHLTSLETTFSDLHVKYEKSKEMTCQLKGNEENLIAENRKNAENLRLQEQRYDKMKNHAMQQLEIANKKLEALAREHQLETTKLKALLKKEEIARSSMSEQLAQKAKENAELVKICDELISGQGS